MNKFFSFEMVFHTGQKYMGNMCLSYSDITCDADIQNVEAYIKQKLNANQSISGLVDVVTITSWKTL